MSGFGGTAFKGLTQADIVNNLTSMATDKPLSAAQGKALSDQIANLIAVENKTRSTNMPTISANSSGSLDIDVTKTGYRTLGAIQMFGSGTTGLVIQEFFTTTDTNFRIFLRNTTGSAITPNSYTVRMLYIKS